MIDWILREVYLNALLSVTAGVAFLTGILFAWAMDRFRNAHRTGALAQQDVLRDMKQFEQNEMRAREHESRRI